MPSDVPRWRGNTQAGEQRHNAVLTEQDVRDIRASDGRVIDLAAHYGVHPTAISAVRNRRTWKHIP